MVMGMTGGEKLTRARPKLKVTQRKLNQPPLEAIVGRPQHISHTEWKALVEDGTLIRELTQRKIAVGLSESAIVDTAKG